MVACLLVTTISSKVSAKTITPKKNNQSTEVKVNFTNPIASSKFSSKTIIPIGNGQSGIIRVNTTAPGSGSGGSYGGFTVGVYTFANGGHMWISVNNAYMQFSFDSKGLDVVFDAYKLVGAAYGAGIAIAAVAKATVSYPVLVAIGSVFVLYYSAMRLECDIYGRGDFIEPIQAL